MKVFKIRRRKLFLLAILGTLMIGGVAAETYELETEVDGETFTPINLENVDYNDKIIDGESGDVEEGFDDADSYCQVKGGQSWYTFTDWDIVDMPDGSSENDISFPYTFDDGTGTKTIDYEIECKNHEYDVMERFEGSVDYEVEAPDDEAPTYSNLSPNDEVVTGEVEPFLTLDAEDNEELSEARLYMDDTEVDSKSLSGTDENGITLTEYLSSGDNDWYFEIEDEAGNINTTETRTITYDDENPSASDLAPTGRVDVYEDVDITADVSDNEELDSYTIDIDGSEEDSGSLSGTSDSISYNYGSDTGTVDYEIEIEDSVGNTDTFSDSFTYNEPPTAEFTASPDPANIDEEIDLNGGDSFDDTGIDEYEWDVDDDGDYEETGETATTSYSSTGDKDITLRVTDEQDTTDTTTETIDVETPSTSWDWNQSSYDSKYYKDEKNISGTYDTTELAGDGELVLYNSTDEVESVTVSPDNGSETFTVDTPDYESIEDYYVEIEYDGTVTSTSSNTTVEKQDPRHTATTIEPTSDTVRMNDEDLVWEYDYQAEQGEDVNLNTGSIDSSGSGSVTLSCEEDDDEYVGDGLCEYNRGGDLFTENGNDETRTYRADIEGQSSGYTQFESDGYDVTWYEPNGTYGGTVDGDSVGYFDRNDRNLEFTWESSDEDVEAFLYYKGEEIGSEVLSEGETISETVDGDVGDNDWYVEVVGEESDNTETFDTQTFTVEEPDNKVSSDSPDDGEEFDSGTSSVDINGSYETDSNGTVELIVDGAVEETVDVTEEGVSGDISTSYPTQDDHTYDWNIEFDSDEGSDYDDSSSGREFTVLEQSATSTITSPSDGDAFEWDDNEVTVDWDSSSNEPYSVDLSVNGTEEYTNSYDDRGSNNNSTTVTLDDTPEQSETYEIETETIGDNTGVSDTDTITVIVEPPKPSFDFIQDFPTEGEVIDYLDRDVTFDYGVETNDRGDLNLNVDDETVATDTVGTEDLVDTVTETFTHTENLSAGSHDYQLEMNGNTLDTVSFEVEDPSNSVDFTSPDDGEEYDSGTSEVELEGSYDVEESGEVQIIVDGTVEETVDVSQDSEGDISTNYSTDDDESYDWSIEFDGDSGDYDTETSDRTFEVLPQSATNSQVSPDDGETFSWDERDVEFEWDSSSNEPYETTLYIDGEVEYVNSYDERGSNTDSTTVELGDNSEDTEHEWYVVTEGTNTGVTEESSTRSLTVEQPELNEEVSLVNPSDDITFPEFSDVPFEVEATTNDVSTVDIIVNGSSVHSETIGTEDRTDEVTETITYSDNFDIDTYEWYAEIGDNSSEETRTFDVRDEILSFDYKEPVDETLREGIDTVDYEMDIEYERNGTAQIVKDGSVIHKENVTTTSGETTETITFTEDIDGEPDEIEWKGRFLPDDEDITLEDGTSASYEIENLPEPELNSPEDGEYFRDLPESVGHNFTVPDRENDIRWHLYINGEEYQNGVDDGDVEVDRNWEDEVGRQNWTVNLTWDDDNGIETDTEKRVYNTGDEDIAEGGWIDQLIETVAEELGMTYTGAAILINFLVSIAVMSTIMAGTKSVGYSLLGGGITFFGLGFVGFLPTFMVALLGLVAALLAGVYVWRTFTGED